MKVSVIGTGYVGLVSGTCFAEIGHQVTCIDIDQAKIDMLDKGISPIYEPGLNDLLGRNISSKRLQFSITYDSVKQADIVFLAVGTPSTDDGQANLKYLKAAAISVAENMKENAIIVIKSTVPVGTSIMLTKLVKEHTQTNFHMVNNPEFLKEGSAIADFMGPDRVLIGHQNDEAAEIMEELYSPLLRQGNPIFMMSNLSAEMSKYAANCFLATKISFINEMAELCDLTGADIEEVRKGIASDKRIGGHFLYPGPGYGGSCFPKDVKALMYTAKQKGMELKIIQATEDVNDAQKVILMKKINKYFNNDLSGRTFAFWGAAFKANTDDVREASSIYMAKALVEAGATVHFFDPVAAENFTKVIKEYGIDEKKVIAFENRYDCLTDCDAMITMTEWREFRNPDFCEIKTRLKSPVIFDGRNLYSTKRVHKEGLDYFAIGKYIPERKEL